MPTRKNMPMKKNTGFTLLEMLIAITLLAMMTAVLYAGLGSNSRAAERGEGLLDDLNRLRTVQQFIRRQIQHMLPLAIEQTKGEKPIRFEGEPQRFRFIAPMPGHLHYAGPHVQTVAVINEGQGLTLQFSHQSLRRLQEDFNQTESQPPVTLLQNVKTATFSYLKVDKQKEITEWQTYWQERDKLPALVRIDIVMMNNDQLSWPLVEAGPMAGAF